jgi:hypothetical protein
MKQILLLLFSIFLLSFVGYNPNAEKPKYFEGQITYDIEYAPYEKRFKAEKIKEHLGSKMVLTFKDGDYKKEYFAPDGKLLQVRALNLKEEKTYLKLHDSDTIFWFDITKNESFTKFEILKDSTVFNYPCKVVKTNTTMTIKNFSNESVDLDAMYLYAIDLPINAAWYENYYEGNFNEIAKIGEGIALLSIIKGLYWEQTIKVTSVNKRKVKRSELTIKIDKDASLKEL